MASPSTAAIRLSQQDIDQFRRDGYLTVRGVLSADEVASLRRDAIRIANQCKDRGLVIVPSRNEILPVPDLVTWDEVGWLLSDERIVGLARQLLGQQEIVYFGDSGIVVGAGARGFHKDNTERVDRSHPDWQSDYTLLRFGIYLQDHVHHSGGLKIRAGSHNHADVTTGRSVDIATVPGDIVIWSLRTSHSGNVVKMRGLSWASIPIRLEARLPQWLRVPESETRVALFLTLAANDDHLRRYLAKYNDLQAYPNNYMYLLWQHSHWTPERMAKAAARGCQFLKPCPAFGSLYHPTAPIPGGPITPGRSKPDLYPVHGMERIIQGAGRLLRRT